jgi:hypothetical protein
MACTSGSGGEQGLPLWVVANVGGSEGALWDDRSPGDPNVLQHPVHEASSVSLTPMFNARGYVRDCHDTVVFDEVGNADDLAVATQLELTGLDLLQNDEDVALREVGEFGLELLVRRLGEMGVVVEDDDRDPLDTAISLEDDVGCFGGLLSVDILERKTVLGEVGLRPPAVSAPVGAVHRDRHCEETLL